MWAKFSMRAIICAGLIAITAVSLGGMKNNVEVTETYIVKSGDTIWSVSEKFLPDGKYILEYQYELVDANPELKANGCRIKPGDKIKIVR